MQLKRTKIVCTIGPSSWDEKTLTELTKAGMNVARLNFSHGSYEEKLEQIKLVRKISNATDKPLAVMADLQGPKLRLGKIEGRIEIEKGDSIHLSTTPQDKELPMQFDISPFVKKGERVFLNDGLVELKVTGTDDKTIKTIAQNDGWVTSNKGVNIPDTHLKGAAFTNKDREDAEFAIKHNVDYLALSFVQTAGDVKVLRDIINKNKSRARIISKIEKKEAVINLEAIIKLSDGVMVARGDLAIETEAAEVPVIQQQIIRIARQNYKPVIVATQMLESMIENPRPTRAEVSDVANAVLDQVDGVMLSAETANGKYPVETVKVMKEVILSVENHPDYKHYIKINWEQLAKEEIVFSAVTSAAASLAYHINAKLIVVATATGRTARVLSSFRPQAPIYAVTHDEQTCDQLALVWGVKSGMVKPVHSSDKFWKDILESVRESGFVKTGDQIVIITGSKIGVAGDTDSIKVETV